MIELLARPALTDKPRVRVRQRLAICVYTIEGLDDARLHPWRGILMSEEAYLQREDGAAQCDHLKDFKFRALKISYWHVR